MTSRINRKKLILAQWMSYTGASQALFSLQGKLLSNNYIRAINYHDTPASSIANFEKQMRFYRRHFSPVSLAELEDFIQGKEWHKDKPGLIISFDDGLKTNFDVALPLLEKYGFIGWFFVPTEFISTPLMQQRAFVLDHAICRWQEHEGDRIAMSWDELRQLDKKHVIGCHTQKHHRLIASTSNEEMEEEIIQAKQALEEQLGHEVNIFCWVGGEEHTYSSAAVKYIREAGYRYAFMTNSEPILPHSNRLQLQRTNIESFWPLALVRFQLSGFMDVLYLPKRKRVNKLTRSVEEAVDSAG